MIRLFGEAQLCYSKKKHNLSRQEKLEPTNDQRGPNIWARADRYCGATELLPAKAGEPIQIRKIDDKVRIGLERTMSNLNQI